MVRDSVLWCNRSRILGSTGQLQLSFETTVITAPVLAKVEDDGARESTRWMWVIAAIVLALLFIGNAEQRAEAAKRDKWVRRASRALGVLELLLPERLMNEEVGDALEVIDRRVKDPRCRHPVLIVLVKVTCTFFWIAVSAVRCRFGKAVQGKKSN